MEFRPSGADRDPSGSDRRRSVRFSLVVPVVLGWKGPSGDLLQCEGRAVEGNAQGGFLEIPAPVSVGTELALRNLVSGESVRAHVVRERFTSQGVFEGIGVAFVSPAPSFWGVTFRLKKATSELRALEQEIKSGGIDPRVLRDFRDAVDYVRKTAWAVQEWQERQIQQHDTATLLPLLTAERIRRTTELSTIILTDLADKQITTETAGVVELLKAIERLHARLADALATRESS
jgi:hypothetical protein